MNNSLTGVVKLLQGVVKTRRETNQLRKKLTRSKIKFYSVSRRGNPTPVARFLDDDYYNRNYRTKKKKNILGNDITDNVLSNTKSLVRFLESIIILPIAIYASKPENIKAVTTFAHGLINLFRFLNTYIGTTASALTGGFFKLMGGNSILERLVGVFQLIGGFFMFKGLTRLLQPTKIIKDFAWLSKNAPNVKNLIQGIIQKNSDQVAKSFGKIFPKTFQIFKKGLSNAISRALIQGFGKSGSKLMTKLGKGILASAIRPLSRLIGRVPILGPLLMIPINMLLGDPIDKAAFKATGAGLGALAVGLLGSVVPGAGNILGAVAGGLLGELLASWIYDKTIQPIKDKYNSENPQLNTGGIAKGPETGYPVTLHGVEAVIPISKFNDVVLSPYQQMASTFIGATLAVVKSFGPLGATLHPYALQLMNPFIRIFGLKTTTYSSNIGKDNIQKLKIDKKQEDDSAGNPEITRKNSLISAKSSTPSVAGGGSGSYDPLLDLIASKESTTGGYEAMYPGTTLPGATKMTIAEVVSRAGTAAVGRWQNLPHLIIGRAKKAGLDPNKDLYNEENQRKIAVVTIEEKGITMDMIKNNPMEAMKLLSEIWAVVPRDQSGRSTYEGYNGNSAKITVKEMMDVFQKLSRGGKVSNTGKLGDGMKLGYAKRGYCVTGVLNTMEANKVPNPKATGGNGENNHPRGLASLLMNKFGWSPLNDVGKPMTLNSPHGKANVKGMTFSQWKAAVNENKIPSGSIVFTADSSRHKTWNKQVSSGFDAAIAQRGGRGLWSGHPQHTTDGVGAVYGKASDMIFALVHGNGQGFDSVNNSNTAEGNTDSKPEESQSFGAMDLISNAKYLYQLLTGSTDKVESMTSSGGTSPTIPAPTIDTKANTKIQSIPSMSTQYMLNRNPINLEVGSSPTIINSNQMVALNNSYGSFDIPDPFEDTTIMSIV